MHFLSLHFRSCFHNVVKCAIPICSNKCFCLQCNMTSVSHSSYCYMLQVAYSLWILLLLALVFLIFHKTRVVPAKPTRSRFRLSATPSIWLAFQLRTISFELYWPLYFFQFFPPFGKEISTLRSILTA
jgi:hypothetical protein